MALHFKIVALPRRCLVQKPSKLQSEAGVAQLLAFLGDTFAHRLSVATGWYEVCSSELCLTWKASCCSHGPLLV